MDYLFASAQLSQSFRAALAKFSYQKVKSAGFHAMNDFFSANNHKCRAFAELSWRGLPSRK
jgi:hypothetical protein